VLSPAYILCGTITVRRSRPRRLPTRPPLISPCHNWTDKIFAYPPIGAKWSCWISGQAGASLAAPRAIIEETPAVEAIEGAAEGAPEPEVIGKGPGDEEEAEGGDESPGKKGVDSSAKK